MTTLLIETFLDRIGVACVVLTRDSVNQDLPYQVLRSKTSTTPPEASDFTPAGFWMVSTRTLAEARDKMENLKSQDFDQDYWADERYCRDDEERSDAGYI